MGKSRKRKLLSDSIASTDDVSAKTRMLHIDDNQSRNVDPVTEENVNLLPTHEVHAQQIIVAAKAHTFAIIEGPIGCGKTFLAAYAAKELNVPLRIVQMGDQVDAKSMLGMYHGTEVAGEFHWTSSALTQWLSTPCFLLIEDVDLANADVISKILALVEKRIVYLPDGTSIPLTPQTYVVATITKKMKRICAVLDSVVVRIEVAALTDAELKRLVAQAYPRIAHLAKTLCKIFRSIESLPCTGNSRQLTSTDFLRGCARISELADLSSNSAIFAELCDVWCLSDPEPRRSHLLEKIAVPLVISPDAVNTHLNVREPMLKFTDNCIQIGRCTLHKNSTFSSPRQLTFGHTRDVIQLMEKISVCVKAKESVLLVGETGVGKTSVVQFIADRIGKTLHVVNLSPSSDTDELIEGFKPTTIMKILQPFTHFYYELFVNTFDKEKNASFLRKLETSLSKGRFMNYLTIVEVTAQKALNGVGQAKSLSIEQKTKWSEALVRARRIRAGLETNATPFTLSKGAVKEAAEAGDWLLIDEINLASPECLDAIVHSLDHCHPEFRLFACMNPATDTGKRRLPTGVRTKFTEFYVAETADPAQLALIVSAYIPTLRSEVVQKIVNFYVSCKHEFPYSFSLRTLCRAMLFAADHLFGNLERSLLEALEMAFLSNLEKNDKEKMRLKISTSFSAPRNIEIPAPDNNKCHVKVSGYWLERGPEPINVSENNSSYVITPTVKENLAAIARIVCSGRFPILLEGETSAGKTSIICHLAKITGCRVTRINNHEHTDVQEYMGSYIADNTGRLVFRKGALVQAVENGDWVILDELNLAPTDVIEALNRLLDDNRELFIPELNKVVKAHPSFRLFATQNPAGTYAGRKKLSRALLSRFVVLRFTHLPFDELSAMVCTRCGVPSSAASKMITILSELRLRRSLSGLFSARDGLMTLRDVFRWAKRLATDEVENDWLQSLANHGYFLLAGRCRNARDVTTVVETLEKVLKRRIDADKLFSADSIYYPKHLDTSGIVLTREMRRMLVMTYQAWLRDEAVLVVGETGGGKTRLAETMSGSSLLTINCHERTETADLLGRLRPRENGGFEWSNGVVIQAMSSGVPLLIDEISLAEDSVLERLNPLFEEHRSLLLSDAGVDAQTIEASSGFQLIATMNPGGDYGKKELSKALRNRFTEIWATCEFASAELLEIFASRLRTQQVLPSPHAAQIIIQWIAQFWGKFAHIFRSAPSVRDIVACADLFAACRKANFSEQKSIREAIHSCFLDALALFPTRVSIDALQIRKEADLILLELLEMDFFDNEELKIHHSPTTFIVGALQIELGNAAITKPKGFSLEAPTCISNLYRIARGLLIKKPILLEGAPGCGKSSTVMALAQLSGHPIIRINLSEQTDLSDLFGSDVPVMLPDGTISFTWRDGPVLQAIKNGEWVLLDEMNLASQSVLEGLNACFDHRRILYIAEINKSFEIPENSNVRFFACQNPRAQGGSRRALPKSFINRFTNIYIDDLTQDDIFCILSLSSLCENISHEELKTMIATNAAAAEETSFLGGPFSFNLRDLLRWVELSVDTHIASAFDTLYVARMRSAADRARMAALFEKCFERKFSPTSAQLSTSDESLRFGDIELNRYSRDDNITDRLNPKYVLSTQAQLLKRLATAVQKGWLTLLIGPRNYGKRSAVECLAALSRTHVETLALSGETDAQELIGSYEQIVDLTNLEDAKTEIKQQLRKKVPEEILSKIDAASTIIELETAVELGLSELNDTDSEQVNNACRHLLKIANKSMMKFDWIDSAFVTAYLNGYWLLIEDVNLCSGAVLDRLNSCLESDGSLVIAERGDFEPIKPHPSFRVFLSMDPRNGEVSRAMRNRALEVFVDVNWTMNLADIEAVIKAQSSKQDLVINENILKAVANIEAERILHFGILTNSFDVDEATRAIGLCPPEIMDQAQSVVLMPLEKVDDTQFYTAWMCEQWKRAAEDDPFNATLWQILSASPASLHYTISLAHTPEIFKDLSQFVKRQNSMHPIDSRFNGAQTTSPKSHAFTITAFSHWCYSKISAAHIHENSANHLSSTLTKYELSTSDFAFECLPQIAPLVREICSLLKYVNHKCFERQDLLLKLLLFTLKTYEKLSDRAGAAPLHIAWAEIGRLNLASEMPPELNACVNRMNQAWSYDANSEYASFLKKYQQYRLVDSFKNADEFKVFTQSTIESAIRDVDMVDDEAQSPKSVLEFALKIVEAVEDLHSFLIYDVVVANQPLLRPQKIFTGLSWLSDSAKRLASASQLLATAFFEETRILSLARLSPFAVINSAFWSALSFNPSLPGLKFGDLGAFSLSAFHEKLWRLASNAENISASIASKRSTLQLGVDGWTVSCHSAESWTARLNTGLELMHVACPPRGSIDPVIHEEAYDAYLQAQLSLITSALETLAKYRAFTTSQEPDVDADSRHPIINTLWNMKISVEQDIESRCKIHHSSVFRQRYRDYDVLLIEMLSFTELSNQFADIPRELNSATALGQMELLCARLNSFAISAESFVNRCFGAFGSFVDVAAPFILGVLVVRASLLEAADHLLARIKKQQMVSSLALPPIIQFSRYESNALEAWALRDTSPMPLHLKAALIGERLSKRDDVAVSLEWIRSHWKKWYERNVAKALEKEFVYRDKSQEEREDAEREEFFDVEVEKDEISVLTTTVLTDLLTVSCGIKNEDVESSQQTRLMLAKLWLRDVAMDTEDLPLNQQLAAADDDLRLLSSFIAPAKQSSFDVYRTISVIEVRKALDLLEILRRRVLVVLERWPEVVSLRNILEAVAEFEAESLSANQMKAALRLEAVIVAAEEWIKLADRANTVRDELVPLQELLLEWKKMEVRSWSCLLNRTAADSRSRALLVAFPLYEALLSSDSGPNKTIVPQAIEWMHHGAVVDFAARIQSVRGLAQWAELLGKTLIATQLISAAAHFAQFQTVIDARVLELQAPVEQSLKDYVHIAKYSDLNLDSIKASSHKAHMQLFKIIKRFRDSLNEPVSVHLEKLLDVDNLMNQIIKAREFAEIPDIGKSKRAHKLLLEALETTKAHADTEEFEVLREQIEACDKLVRTKVKYEGEDSEKEKQQGHERNRRQRAVAMVIKEAQGLGLNARRAAVLKREILSELSVSGLEHDLARLPNESLVRAAAAGRSNIIRAALTPNDQLGASTCAHFAGMVEYGLHWLLSLQKGAETWTKHLSALKTLVASLKSANLNSKASFFIQHSVFAEALPEAVSLSDELYALLQNYKDRIDSAPDSTAPSDASHYHALALLHRSSPELQTLERNVVHALSLATEIRTAFSTLSKNAAASETPIFDKLILESNVCVISPNISTLREILHVLEPFFTLSNSRIREILAVLETRIQLVPAEPVRVADFIVDPLLLFVQNVYKTATAESGTKASQKSIDKFEIILKTVENSAPEKLLSALSTFIAELAANKVPENLDEVTEMAQLCFSALQSLIIETLNVQHVIAGTYHRLLSLAEQLFKQGYVNLIPKPEKTEGGEGMDVEGEEGGGMGEGQGSKNAKDVTDEMEETGQIEGLQDDEPENTPDGPSMQNEKPIEMEDDFPEEIRDIDRDDKNDKNEDENENEEQDEQEPQVDDELGEVDEAEEDKLDPKLWDDDEKEQREKQLDQNNQAADNETNDLAAKDEDRNPEQATEEKESEKDQEGQDDMENVDEQRGENDAEECDDKQEESKQDEPNVDDTNDQEIEEPNIDLDGKIDENEEPEIENAVNEEDVGEEAQHESEEITSDQEPAETEEEKGDSAEHQGQGGEKVEENSSITGLDANNKDEDMQEEGEGMQQPDKAGEAKSSLQSQKEIIDEKNAEDATEENKEVDKENESQKMERCLAEEEDVEMADAEEGEGNEDEKGELAEQTNEKGKHMLGDGSLEEARKSKKDEVINKSKQKKKQPKKGIDIDGLMEEETENIPEDLPSTIHLAPEGLFGFAQDVTEPLLAEAQIEEAKNMVPESIQETRRERTLSEADTLWGEMSHSVDMLSAELAENLRLILEPQRATKLQGDYRSGKRLNMRRLIPYIASQYRKDRIWMRRTKKAQREYQILIAVDDSGSMNETGMGRITCESVCVVDDALRKVDAGHVQVVSFGENVRELRSWCEPSQPGPALLTALTFEQSKTDLIGLLNWSARSLDSIRTTHSEQLLIIISDGRGALFQGAEQLRTTLRALHGVTVLFVVLDIGTRSIQELNVASFEGADVKLTPYLSLFPFPFYALVKSVAQLPSVLSESIRQWFELCVQQGD